MMQKMVIVAALFLLARPVTAGAQVIEIGASGEATTFDQPTVFANGVASPIRDMTKRPQSHRESARLVAQAAQDHGLDPKLLEAVAWQESRGYSGAVSLKGARGVMQLMPSTAAELGVDIDDLTDNIRGGAVYLRQQLDRFGSVPLALAAYNAGPGAVLRYGGIPPYGETRVYVARIMEHWRSTASQIKSLQQPNEVAQP